MKSIISTLLCLFVFSFSYGQEMYWTVYNMKVDADQQEHVLKSLTEFFESETGKNLPGAWVNSLLFGNSEADFNMQVGFSTSDKADFGKMYSGYLNTNQDFRVLMHVLDDHTKPRGSYLGKSINFKANPEAKVAQVVSLNVTDPVTYAAEFKKMTDAIHPKWDNKVTFNLHQMVAGNEPDVTHIVVVQAPDFETMLTVNDMLYEFPEFQTFLKNVKDSRRLIGNFMTTNVMQFNMPTSTMARN